MPSNHQNSSVFDVIEKTAFTSIHDKIGGNLQNLMSLETQDMIVTSGLDSSSSDSEDEKSPRKSKEVSKTKRVRKLNENSKWTSQDIMKYWKFWVDYQIKNPYQNLSWFQWKRDSIYKHMAAYIGKTPKQCKSKDQNLKSKLLGLGKEKDILDIAISKLKQSAEKDDELDTYFEKINSLKKEVSEHMKMLNRKMEMLKNEEDQLHSLMSLFKDRDDDI